MEEPAESPPLAYSASATGYICTVEAVAKRLNCRPKYLSNAALSRGYHYSRALRWIRFFHVTALLGEVPVLDAVARAGFDDVAGWSHFVKRLVGKRPGDLPVVPLDFWVRIAIEDVYLGIRWQGGAGTPETDGTK